MCFGPKVGGMKDPYRDPLELCVCQREFLPPYSLYFLTQWINKRTCFFLVLPFFLSKLCVGNHIFFSLVRSELGVFHESVRKHLFGFIDLPGRCNLLIDLSRAAADVFLTVKYPDTAQRERLSGKACCCIMETRPPA